MSTTAKQTSSDSEGLISTAINAPVTIFMSILSSGFAVIRPYTPRLIPLLVCAFFVPLIIFVSLGVGYFVWSSISASWEAPLYLQYGDGVPPYAHVQLPRLISQQKYAIFVDLQLPVTETNIGLGNFMTSLTLLGSSNKTLAHVRRPAIALTPSSNFFFAKPTSIRISVPLVDAFMASSSNLAAIVEIGRRDSWTTLGKGEGREVNVASASLRGLAVPHGVRGLAIRFPLLSSVASAFIFVLILLVILGLCTLPLVVRSEQEETALAALGDLKVKKERKRSTSRTLSEAGPQRRRSRSLQREGQAAAKPEVVEVSIPQEEELLLRGLRKRTSRPSIGVPETET